MTDLTPVAARGCGGDSEDMAAARVNLYEQGHIPKITRGHKGELIRKLTVHLPDPSCKIHGFVSVLKAIAWASVESCSSISAICKCSKEQCSKL